jgi:DNA-binding transcriptional LysR family regulator
MIFKKNGNIVENLGDIRLFVEAANLGGLSAAGRKLGLSPAAARNVIRH